jgi:transglutaminase-like putative cysteine protease
MSRLIAIEHETRYRYATPVEVSQHVAFLRPLEDERQRVERFEMDVSPEPSHHSSGRDVFGNSRTFFGTTLAHGELSVHTRCLVRVRAPERALGLDATPPWESVAERLRYAAGRRFEPSTAFREPSPYVPRLATLHALGAACFGAGTPVALGAEALMKRIHAEFEYRAASTAVDTPLADVLRARRGVCQDFAHLMIGALRILGLAARYVSGYLLTESAGEAGAGPPEAGERPCGGQGEPAAIRREGRHLVGADASHAWVALWCPGIHGGAGGDWLELDPTNAVLPAADHVRLAVGRDYGDVAPLRGVIRGGGAHTLDVRVRTEAVAGGPGVARVN